jgi:3-deoxy-7-phosphoheptulonate synthase
LIIKLKNGTRKDIIETLVEKYTGSVVHQNGQEMVITPSSFRKLDNEFTAHVDDLIVTDNDIQLSGKSYFDGKREIKVGELVFGGHTNKTVVIAGPCSVESEEQIFKTARFLKGLGINIMRAGAFKPRTSPYSFQGLGTKGLELLGKVRDTLGLKIITEAKDASHIDEVIEFADIIQIGAKAMYDHALLTACSKARKPVLLKRGFGSTIQEFVQAAEFILLGGNDQVILCERGIRTFENKTRFTLDLTGVAYLKHHTNLPIVVDPSHAMGYSYGVPDLSKAAMAMGVDGLLLEVHPTPKTALSDAKQQLDFDTFEQLYADLQPIANAVNVQIS